MKIITWNCNGAFRKKYHLFDNTPYDVLVVQECEDPKYSTKEYKRWASNYLWIGTNKNKGLGIFVKDNQTLKLLNWSDKNSNYQNEMLELFLPIKVDNIIIVGVWTKHAKSEVFGYIGQFWKYLQLHKKKLDNEKVIILGDFNSNKIWDKWDRWWNHSDCVKELEDLKIKSLYHLLTDEKQGEESKPTFFLQRKLEKKYHIDYVFLSESLITKNTNLSIGEAETWLENSDHLPIFTNL